MTLSKLFTALLLTLALGAASAGNMILLEEAAEFDALALNISANGKATLRIRGCDECDNIKLKITPATTLRVGGKQLPLMDLNKRTLRHGTVFYKADSRVVTRIEAVR